MSFFAGQKSKIFFITFVTLILLALTSAITWWIAMQFKTNGDSHSLISSTHPITQIVSSSSREEILFPAGSPDPLMPYDFFWMWRNENRLSSEKGIAESSPSIGCQKSFGWPSVQIPMDQFNQAFGAKPGEIAELPVEVNPDEICFTVGYGIWLVGVQPTTAGLFSPDAIWSRIVRTEKGSDDRKIKLITQFVGTPIYHWPSRVLPPFHPQAKILNREGLRQLFSDFDYVVDVRTNEMQKKWFLNWKKHVSIPYIASSDSLVDYKADRTDNRKARHTELGDQWSDEIWKKWSPEKKILIIGQNPTDPRPFRALTWLAESGLKNLYWFYEGVDAFFQPFNEVPNWNTYSPFGWTDHIPNIQQQIVSDQAVLIDVRSAEEFQRIRDPQSVNKPYKEMSTDGFANLRGLEALDVFHILKSKDTFDLSQIPQDKKIYLMGADRYDWRAIKIFVRLKHRSPQQDVRVIRDGLAEFGLWQRIDRNLIKLDGTKSDEVH